MPMFSGDFREYAIFRSDFKHVIEARYIKRDAITFLRTCLQGKSLDLIKGIGSDYEAAWKYLDSIYGDPRFVSDTITQDIVKFRPIRDGEDARFCDLLHLVKRCYNTQKKKAYRAIWTTAICFPLSSRRCAWMTGKSGQGILRKLTSRQRYWAL